MKPESIKGRSRKFYVPYQDHNILWFQRLQKVQNYIFIRICDVGGNSLNQELETLGWGIRVMDEAAYKQVSYLHRRQNFVI